VIEEALRQHLMELMERDRVWCAYALADLDPPEVEQSKWLVDEDSVVLLYKGFDPPILFAYGDPDTLMPLFRRIPAGVYQYSLRSTAREILGKRLQPKLERNMWRMVLDPTEYPGLLKNVVKRLTTDDLPAIINLFESSPDPPDAFHERQLTAGPFFGIYEGEELICIAGIHVLSKKQSVAAIGNVLTRPGWRRRGLATRSSSAVVSALLKQRIQTIVLNVAKENEPAMRCYLRLGFQPACSYYEGIGKLAPMQV
jgi:ribosomal protein S18 acetylase RimI-like enzyme